MFSVRLATPDDLEVILGLIDDAADWLRTMNTDQWAQPWPNRRERDARVLRGLLACRTWLVEDDGVPVATVTYRPDGNRDLWTDEEQRESSVYMSRLVINRKYEGQGVGAALTDWAGARARDEYGAETLKIDVWTTNHQLHEYYKGRGFHFLRKYEEDESYPSAALFSKPTEDIDVAPESLFWEVRAIAAAPIPRASQSSAPSSVELMFSDTLTGSEAQEITGSPSSHQVHLAVRKCLSAARDQARMRHRKRHNALTTWTHLVTLVTVILFSPGSLMP
jgi:GNAT superfamily N-acetyltransferase